ncbi:phycobilisome rod-core linker polypeptide [Desertifilum sp. FACHB-1129]|uniref:Phycobilisome linker polypeptide n=2 Tax=Desertifilum tharense IPPAS B-1220 TaxID=1781255 RepID=A0A1E5QEE5_9CYAN|nr:MULTISPECIES: phycobilisome rod-core linker polypeptide [Desertifilum]MDA0213419.1 phycobilisome rod-core linker polypeptide [Cyanobacteria bacterium FC1]MBD2314898.1 phycobilisome rod-core linker polypeptide [Desertifilum sp. FACHB-1129]MBD2322900.1 phycobilisome rod-core linker polypeptide [Desertifilum sp. FACHB-866]MBD2335287.1 phycobilisome rod-core linker polypeptide [Desertifilum sp. FACHB-868]OEJ73040.1 phycobilisome linker polypeptide [Desertifilum tharense IPPAS B-1220]
MKPITVSRRSTLEERQNALRQIYTQVLERQPYAYERKILQKAEQDFLKDKIGVRRFLKELGHSEVYQNAFYTHCSNLKFLELCFKHFLGRAPINQEEVQLYCDILMRSGVNALITALLDSEEYRKVFGCFSVPYARPSQYYASPKAFLETHLLNHEYIGQRGVVVPTIYWHQLGLNCDAGLCHHPEAGEVLHPPISPEGERLQEQLQELLRLFESNQAQEAIASLSPQQKAALRKVIRE